MKYLRLIPILLLGAMLTSCNTNEKLYYAKEYDKVIQRLAPEICKGNKNPKRINLVAASYNNANRFDYERIQGLKASGQPDVWPEIYQRYCSMKGRSEALDCYPSSVKNEILRNRIHYVPLNFDDDMMVARNKAESFLVAKANQLLNSGSKADAVEAEKYVEQLWRTNPENSKLLDLRKKCALFTNDYVNFGYVGCNSHSIHSHSFRKVVFDFDEGELPSQISNVGIVNDPRPWENRKAVVCVIEDNVTISPIRLDEVTFKETKGSQTVEVTDHTQTKSIKISGYIQYRTKNSGEVLGSVPFEVTSTFKNDYTTIKGDREACSAETLSRLDSHPVPVPTDESMLLDAAKKLNDLIAAELRK